MRGAVPTVIFGHFLIEATPAKRASERKDLKIPYLLGQQDLGRLHARGKPTSSPADAVPQDEHAVAEPTLLEQLQVQPHAVRKEPLSAADDHGADDHLELVDKTGLYRLRGRVQGHQWRCRARRRI
jgi:hypothetical protein